MGLDFMLAGACRPADRDPDWGAMYAAADRLPDDVAQRLANWLGWDDDDQDGANADVLGDARAVAADAVLDIHDALTRGSTLITVVEHRGWRFYLDGGVSSGEDPTPSWEQMVRLTESGLLGAALAWYSDSDGPPPALFDLAPASEAEVPNTLTAPIARITEASRILAFGLPPEPDWPAAHGCVNETLTPAVDRLEEVVAGAYSRTVAVAGTDDAWLLLIDRLEPRTLETALELEQALAAAGIVRLEDVRL